MKNKNLECDFICSTCNDCIYDSPDISCSKNPKPIIPTTTNIYKEKVYSARTENESKFCNGCKFLESYVDKKEINLYSFSCAKSIIPIYKKNRLIKYKTGRNQLISKPTWCPLKKNNNMNFFNFFKKDHIDTKKLSPYEITQIWKNTKGLNSFDTIKVGCWYHIPPVNDKPRKDVYVLSKSDYGYYKCIQAGCDINDIYHTEYIYNYSEEANFMVEIKNPSYKKLLKLKDTEINYVL